MEIQLNLINDASSYDAAMARVDGLMEMNNGEGPEPGTKEAVELEILSLLAEKYEEQTFPLDLPSPVEAVVFALEQRGMAQKDLGHLLKSRSRASELLNGKLHQLSGSMIRTLNSELRIPAEVLIQKF